MDVITIQTLGENVEVGIFIKMLALWAIRNQLFKVYNCLDFMKCSLQLHK